MKKNKRNFLEIEEQKRLIKKVQENIITDEEYVRLINSYEGLRHTLTVKRLRRFFRHKDHYEDTYEESLVGLLKGFRNVDLEKGLAQYMFFSIQNTLDSYISRNLFSESLSIPSASKIIHYVIMEAEYNKIEKEFILENEIALESSIMQEKILRNFGVSGVVLTYSLVGPELSRVVEGEINNSIDSQKDYTREEEFKYLNIRKILKEIQKECTRYYKSSNICRESIRDSDIESFITFYNRKAEGSKEEIQKEKDRKRNFKTREKNAFVLLKEKVEEKLLKR